MSLLDRVRALFGRAQPEPLSPDDPALVVVAENFDPSRAASTVLADSPGWASTDQVVLRHVLLLPADRVDEAAGLIGQDGYELRGPVAGQDGPLPGYHAVRTQVVTPLDCSREHSRMASLAQRLGGDAPGWQLMQPRPEPPAG
ncbi:hypothetical protein [Actinokineospora bangkokensis]|uniref:Uncharacterized protein n=1 Tax=Actinokineospora bangkokensis TaxID=1193682 RepID=A0A1Q9LTA6_9PSEU|nr:hypothetical protein [Actinokineospora bangkokensis]OLR95272.1 hypothetical protein BJP25_07230 [Actinokineospora bangkokensis]